MHSPGQSVHLRGSARSDMGQVRENNEDYVHLWSQDAIVLAIVADGMGGAAAGEEASRIAVDTVQKGLPNQDSEKLAAMGQDTLKDALVDVVHRANLNIVERAVSRPELKGMGTTVTLALVRKTQVTIAHVGDSRAYLVNGYDSSIVQITSDHSFVEALLAAGHITREQAEDHPMRNVLYRALGQSEEIDVDIYYSRLHVGDRLVLCSDGLTRHVKPDEIAQLVLSDENPEVASQKLIDLANQRGGEDNVSVIVVAVEEDETAEANNSDEMTATEDEDTVILENRPKIHIDISSDDTLPSRPHDPTPKPTPLDGTEPSGELRARVRAAVAPSARHLAPFGYAESGGEGSDPYTLSR